MKRRRIHELLEATRAPDAKVRKTATRELCPGEIQVNDSRALGLH